MWTGQSIRLLLINPQGNMKRRLLLFVCTALAALSVSAQNPQPSTPPKPRGKRIVTAAQVNGVYRYYDNEFRMLALGQNRIKFQFDGLYHTISKSVNTGYMEGVATIENDTASFVSEDNPQCKLAFNFLPRNRLKVTQEGSDAVCGFGHNVFATGTYRKIRGGKPKFESPP
jgi:hypothetical protein